MLPFQKLKIKWNSSVYPLIHTVFQTQVDTQQDQNANTTEDFFHWLEVTCTYAVQ